MPAYISLNQFTEEALDDLEAMEEAMAEDIAALEELGGEFHGLWLTFGQYDAVGITELPDDETAMRLVGHLNRNRGTGTETLKAIPADEAGSFSPRASNRNVRKDRLFASSPDKYGKTKERSATSAECIGSRRGLG